MSNDQSPTSTPPIIDGNLSLITVNELPRATPTTAPNAAAAGANVDKFGTVYDPAKHEHRQRVNGAWALKRGNGARKASGASYSVPRLAKVPDTAAAPGSPAVAPPAAAAGPSFAPGSSIGPLPSEPVEHIPEVETSPMLTEADYANTGEAITRGLFGLAQLTLDSKAWEPTPAESRAFAGVFARIWQHYQLPRLGPIIELLFLIPPTIAKRADEPNTKKWLGRIAGLFRRGRAEPEQVEQPPAPQQPAPASRGAVMNPAPRSRFRMG